MKGVLWSLAAIVAALAWNGALKFLLFDAGVDIDAAATLGIGTFFVHCGAVWYALRLRRELRATGSGQTRARFDRPGTMITYRLVGALALALSVAVVGLLIAWIAPLVG